MYYSPVNNEDGYIEVLVSIFKGYPPLFKLRAVLNIRGNFRAVVRGFESGIMLYENSEEYNDWHTAIVHANEWVHELIRENLDVVDNFPTVPTPEWGPEIWFHASAPNQEE